MDLRAKDIARLLNISESKVYELAEEKKIPSCRVNNQFLFSRTEINEWILRNNIPVTENAMHLSESAHPLSVASLLENGGIFYNVGGRTVCEVLSEAVSRMPIPEGMDEERILSALIERESMMPTAIGNGIAVPHPHSPIITDSGNECISICFLEEPIDFGALDHKPVHTIFVILSANPRHHLEVLSKIAFLCARREFLELLEARASKQWIREFIAAQEEIWKNRAVSQ